MCARAAIVNVEGIRHADETATDDAAGGNGDDGPDNSDSRKKVSMTRGIGIEQRLRSLLDLRGEKMLMQILAIHRMNNPHYHHVN